MLELISGKEQIGEHFHYSAMGIQVSSNILTTATGMRKYNMYCENGVGGSVISVIPEADTVMSIACSMVYNLKIRKELINDYLFPYLENL